jgi:enoyl-CoA hydratase/carnithine racemase
MTEPQVHVEDRGAVRILTLDDGKLNGLSPLMRELIAEAFDDAVAAASAEAIVITGAGGNFCAGGDIAAMVDQPLDDRIARLEHFEHVLLGWSDCPKPILVAVEGAAAGGGVAMVAAADWAVAASDARFVGGWPAIGLAPDLGAAWWLVRTVGIKRAYDWLISGTRISADEALTGGLISAIAEPGAALDAAVGAAEKMLRILAPARAASKRLLRAALETPDPAVFRVLERDALVELMQTPEHREAARRFLERSRS